MKKLMIVTMAAALCGCAHVVVSDVERARIADLHTQGVSWSQNPPTGYEPIVKMGPAVCWGLLPGAAQYFIAHKMDDAGITNQKKAQAKLRKDGGRMLLVSWLPWVYDGTMPFGIGGAIQDVNRINNLLLLKYIDEHPQLPPAAE